MLSTNTIVVFLPKHSVSITYPEDEGFEEYTICREGNKKRSVLIEDFTKIGVFFMK